VVQQINFELTKCRPFMFFGMWWKKNTTKKVKNA
jgi:hypothetical protein